MNKDNCLNLQTKFGRDVQTLRLFINPFYLLHFSISPFIFEKNFISANNYHFVCLMAFSLLKIIT
jgi:hypothetical protein